MKHILIILFALLSFNAFSQEAQGLPTAGSGGGGNDGVVSSGTFDGKDIVLARTIGGNVTISGAIMNASTNQTLTSELAAFGDCSGGSITFTLPPAATSNGKAITITKSESSANPLVVSGTYLSGTQKNIYHTYPTKFICDGSAWYFDF